jgi:bacterioferritin-associated ferredoxin
MVDRCICYNVPFSEVASLAKSGQSFDAISETTGCCQGCGMCEPYVRVVIATGRVSLPVLTRAQADVIVAQAEAWKQRAGARAPSADRSSHAGASGLRPAAESQGQNHDSASHG